MRKNIDWPETKPVRIEGEFVCHPVDDEVLLYHHDSHRAACMHAQVYRIFQLCDGSRSIEAVCDDYFSALEQTHSRNAVELFVLEALGKLAAEELIDVELASLEVETNRSGRRDFVTGAIAIGTPLVVGLPIPAAAQGVSCLSNGSPCTSNSQCCSGNCNLGGRNPSCRGNQS